MENIEILVIEDNTKHMEDARAEIQKGIDAGLPIRADYAKTGEEAEALMQSKQYKGIVSDVFFPWSEKKWSLNPQGWDGTLSYICYETLKDFIPDSLEIRESVWDWREGKSMHPTGVYFAKTAKEKNIPVVLCTDTYHHGFATEPVNKYADKNNVILVDLMLRNEEGSIILDKGSSGSTKDWASALRYLLKSSELDQESLDQVWGSESRRKSEVLKRNF